MTGKQSKKLENISKNELIYFCIDGPNSPYKGVRGKGSVKTHEFVETTKEGQGIVLEISPSYYSTWDHNK